MAVVANEDGDIVMQDPLGQESSMISEVGDELEEGEEDETSMDELKLQGPVTRNKSGSQSSQRDPKLRKDMETCFGFDEVSQ